MNYDNYGAITLLLGNGFDLSYSLPTMYADFLHTINYLLRNRDKEFKSVGSVFGDSSLQDKDETIKRSYEKYSAEYHECPLDKTIIDGLVKKASSNGWYSYFSTTLRKDIGWIDFEREILRVIQVFKWFIDKKETDVMLRGHEIFYGDILHHFYKIFQIDFDEINRSIQISVKKHFKTIPHINMEKEIVLDIERIICDLEKEFEEFKEILKTYFLHFVDIPVKKMSGNGRLTKYSFLPDQCDVISFNYTNTFETVYDKLPKDVIHIHGNVNRSIVLGFHPGKEDNKETADTTFISFKKYFQRGIENTEDNFINLLLGYKDRMVYWRRHGMPILLCVLGHSLDITDKDIIGDLFSFATKIIIFYHNISAKKQYIANIIRLFGKDEYDKLRKEKGLSFVPINGV